MDHIAQLAEINRTSYRKVLMPQALAIEKFPGKTLNFVNGYLEGEIRYGKYGPIFTSGADDVRLDNLTPAQAQSITIEPAKIRTLRNLAAAALPHTEATGPYEDVRKAALRDPNVYHPDGGRKTRSRTKMRHTRKHRTRRHRKMRGGYYAFSGAVGPGAANYTRGSEMGPYAVDKAGNMGNMGPNGQREIFYGRGRKGRSRKSRRKTRKTRGGGKYGAVAASFVGTGARGIQDAVGTNTKYPPFGGPGEGAFNDGAAASIRAGNSFDILPK